MRIWRTGCGKDSGRPKGRVQRAEVVATESQQDDCLHDVAVDAALRSRFNEKPGAPALQTGTITYNFVKQ